MKKFDVFIIGTGRAGVNAAYKCAEKNLKTGITDFLPFGGTCPLRGCDPKKVLTGTSEVIDLARRMEGKGLHAGMNLNWKELHDFKQSFVDPMPEITERGLEKTGIACFHEKACFLSPNSLKVGDEKIEASKIVITAGARPSDLDIPGKEYMLTSADFLNLTELPPEIIFIGGGYIALEFAHVAARFGSKVTIMHRGPQILERNFEQDIVKHLSEATLNLGITLIMSTSANKIEQRDNKYIVSGQQGNRIVTAEADAVINSAGRIPAIDELKYETANIEATSKGISVNRFLQNTGNPDVYAGGDVADTDGMELTPVAAIEGETIGLNIAEGNNITVDYSGIPTVVFTIPAMASAGLTEKTAKEKGFNCRINYQSAPGWYNARRLNEKTYAFKTIIDNNTETILGAHLIGPGVEETINFFAIAVRLKLKVNELKKMVSCYSYPSLGSDIQYMI